MKEHYHKFQWFYMTFLAIIFSGLSAYYVIHLGYYPVAIVNYNLISARSLSDEYAVAYRYYAKVLGENSDVDLNSNELKKELRRATLNDLIEKSLIYQELKSKVGKELAYLIEGKINLEGINKEKLEEAASVLYGLSLADFKEMVLVPKAQKEILEGRLFLEKKTYDEWLSGASGNAKVFILTPEFYWDKNKVVLR